MWSRSTAEYGITVYLWRYIIVGHFLLPHIPRFAGTIMQWRERLRHAELTSFISPPLQHDTTVKVSTFSLTRARRCIHYWQVAPEIASSATNQPRIRSTENVRFQTEWIISKNMSVQVCDAPPVINTTSWHYILCRIPRNFCGRNSDLILLQINLLSCFSLPLGEKGI